MDNFSYIKKESQGDLIVCNIDACEYQSKEKIFYLRGWAFSKDNNNVNFSSNCENIKIEHSMRPDVATAFNYKYESSAECGFYITFKDIESKTLLTLTISNNDSFIRYSIDLKLVEKQKNRLRLNQFKKFFNLKYICFSFKYLKAYGFSRFFKKAKAVLTNKASANYTLADAYKQWIKNNEIYSFTDVTKDIKNFKLNPLISIVVPVYNVDEIWLRKCIDSVINQYYTNWELCLADDLSTLPHVKKVLDEYQSKDARIKVVYRTENGHISKASNSALEIATGDYVALLDNDDELALHALYEVVKLINEHPDAEFIYSDEDKMTVDGTRKDPHFKSSWAPDTLMSCNYITHLSTIKKTLIDEIGGFRVGYEGSQDYDLILRITERTNNIYHIPKMLYHWRLIEGSTSMLVDSKNYAYIAGKNALTDALKRRNEINAIVNEIEGIPYFHVSYTPSSNDFISIIIPTKDKASVLETCLKSIYEKTSNKNFEIIIANNGSVEKDTFNLFENYNKKDNFRVVDLDMPFNYAKINNEAAKLAKGNLLLFLNNDTEVINSDWLDEMAGQASRKEIGAVGVKLLYPDDTVQHCGVIGGLGGVAGHAYVTSDDNTEGYFCRLIVNYNYSSVTAACLMVKKDLFWEVNGFTEELAVTFNDIDFCFKLLDKGVYNLCIPKVKLYHYESLSRGSDYANISKVKRFEKEQNYMKNKWKKYIENDPFYNPNLSLWHPDFRIDPLRSYNTTSSKS